MYKFATTKQTHVHIQHAPVELLPGERLPLRLLLILDSPLLVCRAIELLLYHAKCSVRRRLPHFILSEIVVEWVAVVETCSCGLLSS